MVSLLKEGKSVPEAGEGQRSWKGGSISGDLLSQDSHQNEAWSVCEISGTLSAAELHAELRQKFINTSHTVARALPVVIWGAGTGVEHFEAVKQNAMKGMHWDRLSLVLLQIELHWLEVCLSLAVGRQKVSTD